MNAIFYKFIESKNLLWIGILVFTISILSLLYIIDDIPRVDSFAFWNVFLSPLLGVFTAIMGLLIFIKQRLATWAYNLPKLYTAHTFYNGELIVSCYEFHTTSKYDIRQPLQSFLREKTNERQSLLLDAGNQIMDADIHKYEDKWFKRYLFVNSVDERMTHCPEGSYVYFQGEPIGKEFLIASDLKHHTGENPNEHINLDDLPFSYQDLLEQIKNSTIEKSKTHG